MAAEVECAYYDVMRRFTVLPPDLHHEARRALVLRLLEQPDEET